MKAPIYNPSYFDIDKACATLALQVLKLEKMPGRIIGLSRGGLIPSVILSHALNIPMTPVAYSSIHGKGEYRKNENHLPLTEERSLLVVDDISDSGHTLHEVVDYYKYLGFITLSVALYYKKGSVHEPTFYWQEIPADAPWVMFPWET